MSWVAVALVFALEVSVKRLETMSYSDLPGHAKTYDGALQQICYFL